MSRGDPGNHKTEDSASIGVTQDTTSQFTKSDQSAINYLPEGKCVCCFRFNITTHISINSLSGLCVTKAHQLTDIFCLRQLSRQRKHTFSFVCQAWMSRHIISNSIRLAIHGDDKSAPQPTLEEVWGMSGFGAVLIEPSPRRVSLKGPEPIIYTDAFLESCSGQIDFDSSFILQHLGVLGKTQQEKSRRSSLD